MKKKDMNFPNLGSLKIIEKILNEADIALNDKSRTIATSAIPETLAGVLGAGAGGVISFAALYFGGTVAGLSAAGITSGLAAAGAIVGGGMAAGIAVLAAPAVILGGAGIGVASHIKNKKLQNTKEAYYNEAIKKQTELLKALQNEKNADKDRIEYLNSLIRALKGIINDLKHDIAKA